jgi:erythromycin esterase-like protein
MYQGHASSWNLRDEHMADTVTDLANYLTRRSGKPAKVVLWAHNSHLGDARATDLHELNVGQLMRERYGAEVINIGFTTDYGTVTAASEWNGPAQRKQVRPGLQGSYEDLFHQVNIQCNLPNFCLIPQKSDLVREALRTPRLERAIGVIYQPETERASHYFYAKLSDQFDAVIHFDQTRALEPLEKTALWHRGEVATYPFAV